MISRGTLALFVFIFSANVFAGSLSFEKWKTRRVAEKASIVAQIKRDKSLAPEQKQSRLMRANLNLQTEKDLSPEDYFHLYLLTQFKDQPNKARETIQSLSKKELADIVISYINATNQFREAEVSSIHLQTSR